MLASKNIPMYYAYVRLLLRNIESNRNLEQDLMEYHGEFFKHYYAAYQSYLSIFKKGLKYFSNLEQNIKKILEYNHYKTKPPIIVKLPNVTCSKNIFVNIYKSLLFGEKRGNNGNNTSVIHCLKNIVTIHSMRLNS